MYFVNWINTLFNVDQSNVFRKRINILYNVLSVQCIS